MAIHVGRWDCTTCGYNGVLGPETECSNCGADRPKNVKFYMAAEEDIVQDPTVLRRARGDADWRCSFCTQNNPNEVKTCKDCGNSRSASDKQLEVKTYTTANVPRTGDGTRDFSKSVAEVPPPKSKKGCFISLGVLAVVVAVLLLLSLNSTVDVKVEGFEWEQSIQVEEMRNVEEENWAIPSGGTTVTSFQAIHHYDQILDHYETRTRTEQRSVGSEEYVCGQKDLGNGYFEDKYCSRTIYEDYQVEYEEPIYRDKPVYQTKYRYTIDRWFAINPIVTQDKNQRPKWGDTVNVRTNASLREAGRTGIYTVIVEDDEAEIHAHDIPLSWWEKLTIGDKIKAKRGKITGAYRGLDTEEEQ
jgi:hypothetical protein